jgi:hypothetical protein
VTRPPACVVLLSEVVLSDWTATFHRCVRAECACEPVIMCHVAVLCAASAAGHVAVCGAAAAEDAQLTARLLA